MRTAVRLIKIMLPAWPIMALAVLFGWLTVASNIGLMATSAILIASAALHPSVAELSVAIVGVRFFGVARAVFRYLERYISHDATFRILSELRVWFYTRLEPLAPAKLQSWQSGELFGAIVGDIETLKDFYLRVLAPPIVAIMILASMIFFVQKFTVGLVYILTTAFLLTGIGLPLVVRSLNKNSGSELVAVRSELKAYLVDSVEGIADLAAYNRKEDQLDAIRSLNGKLSSLQGRVAALSGLTEALGSLIMNGALWAVLWLMIPLVNGGYVDGIYLAAAALAVQSSFEAVLPLPMAVHYFNESLAAAQRLFSIVDTKAAVSTNRETVNLPNDLSIVVKDVSFTYNSGTDKYWKKGLQNISFELKPGRSVAIVGPSGAGKSTIINLLLRFWEYDSGSITLSGLDYRDLSPEDIRNSFSVVSQQTHIFNATIRDNIILARPDATEAQLMAAIHGAALGEFVGTLPQGLDTAVGHNGRALSGGQRQRIAIARAILKDAPILLLDEAAVGLDALTEHQIMTALGELMKGRTTLMITHRIIGLEAMDKILVLDQGKVVERGRFDSLVEKQGLFYQMYKLQQTYFPN
ncbi:thiol reductant ABC exporter subunit CydC [Dendrosporobacter sp. 1207_IL3150]|uniref:thiol reductant ABC exporter subunit CydC n=1 Tax=Dendrosporobacter sp. 1207_IL3150 TaxID=3084054 RepID=UPI002FDAC06E